MRKHYTKLEDVFIINNFKKMESGEIGTILGRTTLGIQRRITVLRSKGHIGLKIHRSTTGEEFKLEMQGRKNKGYIAVIRGQVRLNKYINLQIKDEKENCEVVFKTFNYFTIKHKNYMESFNYTDVLIGKIKIANV